MAKTKADEFEPKDLARPQRPTYPVAGFWVRAAAFAMDVVLLNFFAYLLIFALKEQLFSLGYYAGFLGVFINLGYFIFFNSLGKGKTPGKFFLNLTILRWSGEPLEPTQAAIRTVIQLNFLLVLHFLMPLFLRDVSSISDLLALQVVRNLVFAFFVANGVLVATHPFKCGFHDLAVQSYVARDPQRFDVRAVLTTEHERMTRWQRSAFQSAGIAFIVIFVLFIFNASRNLLSAEARRQFEIRNDMKARLAIEGFEYVGPHFIPLSEQPTTGTQPQRTPAPTKRDTAATSPTASAPPRGDVEFIYICYGRIDPEAMKRNPVIERTLHRAREWVERDLPPLLKESKQLFEARTVRLSFREVLTLNTYFYAYDKLAYEVSEKVHSAAP